MFNTVIILGLAKNNEKKTRKSEKLLFLLFFFATARYAADLPFLFCLYQQFLDSIIIQKSRIFSTANFAYFILNNICKVIKTGGRGKKSTLTSLSISRPECYYSSFIKTLSAHWWSYEFLENGTVIKSRGNFSCNNVW